MKTLQEEMIKNFEPVVSIEVKDIGMGRKSEVILKKIFLALSREHRTLVNKENGVIYIGK